MRFITLLLTAFISLQSFSEEKFPDGTPIPDWFRQNEVVNIQTLGKKYNILEYGVINDSTLLQTEKIQSVIDQASQQGGGVIVSSSNVSVTGCLLMPAWLIHIPTIWLLSLLIRAISANRVNARPIWGVSGPVVLNRLNMVWKFPALDSLM